MADPDVEAIFEEAQEKTAPGSKKPLTSKDMANEPIKRPSLTQALIDEVAKDPAALPKIARKALEDAGAGDGKARDWVSDRLDGKVVTPLVIEGIESLSDEQLVAVRESLRQAKGGSGQTS